MDLNKAIRDLHEELEKLNQVIAAIEQFQRTGTVPAPRRRGRKSMNQQERQGVSERMKKYWDERRNSKKESDTKSEDKGDNEGSGKGGGKGAGA